MAKSFAMSGTHRPCGLSLLCSAPLPSGGIAPAPAMSEVIQVEELLVTYRDPETREVRTAVDRLTFTVRTGEVFGFLGPNGAGKTSTMNVLLGFTHAAGGSASIFGVDVRQPIARQRIGYLPEMTYYYKFLTAEELLRAYCRSLGLDDREIRGRNDELLPLVAKDLCREAGTMLFVAPVVCAGSVLAGLVLANHYDFPPGQIIAALLAALLLCGWAWRWFRLQFSA